MRCISRKGNLDKYWADSGNPQTIEDLIINKSSLEDKQKIRDLIKYKEALLKTDLKNKYLLMTYNINHTFCGVY